MQLFKHQEQAINLFKERNQKLYLNWETGTGKTRGSLAIANAHGFKNLLIVAPKSSNLSWQTESQYFQDLKLSIITYEAFRDKIGDFSSYDFVIFDEAHRLKNNSAKMTKKAIAYAIGHKLPPSLLLSGTPADRLYEIYTQLRVLNPDDAFFKKYKSYSYFLNSFYYLDKYYKPERIKSQEHKQSLKNWFLKYAHVVKKEDVVELPPLQELTIKLPKEKIDIDIEDFSLYTVATFIQEFRQSITQTKIDWVIDFIEDNPDTIVFSLFKDPVMAIKSKIKHNVYAITGEFRQDFDMALTRQDKAIVTTYALKEGANLQRYKNVVFLAPPLSYRDYNQSLSRVYRTGQTQKVTIYKILQNSIDYKIYGILNDKASVYDYLRKGD
ncbi:TPA: DNA or RNA helicase of superfamily II [Aquificae Joseph's Coat Spring virus]|nr:TPA: DNA or RNA helicase of superfamily II [Aquificae Joseph's Coat Spring virus]